MNFTLRSSQLLAPNVSWKALEAEPQFPTPRRPADYLLRTALEFFDVPSSEYELSIQETCFRRSNPNEEISWKRD